MTNNFFSSSFSPHFFFRSTEAVANPTFLHLFHFLYRFFIRFDFSLFLFAFYFFSSSSRKRLHFEVFTNLSVIIISEIYILRHTEKQAKMWLLSALLSVSCDDILVVSCCDNVRIHAESFQHSSNRIESNREARP